MVCAHVIVCVRLWCCSLGLCSCFVSARVLLLSRLPCRCYYVGFACPAHVRVIVWLHDPFSGYALRSVPMRVRYWGGLPSQIRTNNALWSKVRVRTEVTGVEQSSPGLHYPKPSMIVSYDLAGWQSCGVPVPFNRLRVAPTT